MNYCVNNIVFFQVYSQKQFYELFYFCSVDRWLFDVIWSFKWLNFFRKLWIFSKFARLLWQKVKDPWHGFALNTHHTLCKSPSVKIWRGAGLAIRDDSLMMVFALVSMRQLSPNKLFNLCGSSQMWTYWSHCGHSEEMTKSSW